MKIFITGGTGFIGTYLVNRLTKTEHELCCLARESSDTRYLEKVGARIITGDVREKASFQHGMEGCNWVIHLASSFEFWHPDKRIFHTVNVKGTRNVMEAALESGASKVINVSTAAVYGNAAWPITEKTPVGPKRVSRYVRTKYDGDLAAWELHETQKLPLIVIYPGAVIGAYDPKATGRYIKNFALGRMPAQVLTKTYFSFVSVKDVTEAVVKALEKENNIGEKYLVCAENYTWGEINRMISRISGTKLPFLKLPGWMTLMNSYMITGLSNLLKIRPLLDMSSDQIRLMKQGFQFDGSKTERELGIAYQPISEAFRAAIESIKK